MNQDLLRGAGITPTKDPRIRIGNFGPGNVRTIVQDEPGGEWDITGPPYGSVREAMGTVDDVLCYYFGEQPTRGQLAARIEAAQAVIRENGEARTVAQLQVVIGRVTRALAGHPGHLAGHPGQLAARNEHPLHDHAGETQPWTEDTLRTHLYYLHGVDGLASSLSLETLIKVHDGQNHGRAATP
jgi:hypothetical protein